MGFFTLCVKLSFFKCEKIWLDHEVAICLLPIRISI